MKLKNTYRFLFLALFISSTSCIDPFEFENETFESALVIEATITNELKHQEILLSRSYQFEEEGPNPETNAEVKIIGGNVSYLFQEVEPGKYLSEYPFSAIPNTEYQLFITTGNGRSYTSTPTQLTQGTQIDDLYAVREIDDNDVEGMSIYVDSYDPTGNSRHYRYEYEETYKIIAPRWVSKDLVVIDETRCLVDFAEKMQEERTCYNTEASLNINLVNTNGFSEDRISRHLIRFIDRDSYILNYRYSILVRQYVQSREAYAYYETLADFSGEGSLFSQSQPGFFGGNISSVANAQEKVIGFFDVSSVASKRIYFNYEDFFAGEPFPPYAVSCFEVHPEQFTAGGACGGLINGILTDEIIYVAGGTYVENMDPTIPLDSLLFGPFTMVIRACGDCTALGSNVVPDFWED